jgi:hypothetical protein
MKIIKFILTTIINIINKNKSINKNMYPDIKADKFNKIQSIDTKMPKYPYPFGMK